MVFKQSEVFWRQRDIPVESLLETARAMEREGRVAAAAAAYRQLMRVSPNDPDALIGLSELSARLGNLNASVDALRLVCRRYPDNHALQFRLAEREHARGHNEVATSIWRQLAQRDPQDGTDYRWRGQALEKLGRTDEARAAYVVSAKIAPDDAETFCDLGRLDISAGRNRDGLRNLLRAVELSPKDGLPLSWLARAMLSQDRLEEALKTASTAVDLSPDKPACWIALGRVETGRMALRQAANAFYRALSIDPRSVEAHTGLAELRLAQGRADEAHASYSLAMALSVSDDAPPVPLDAILSVGGQQEDLPGYMLPPGGVTSSVIVIGTSRIGDLDRTLTGLAAQTLRPDSYQVVVVDTSAEHVCAPVVARFAPRFQNFKHLRAEGTDWIDGWNSAVAAADGGVFVVVGEGVRPLPTFLENLLRPFRDADTLLAMPRVLPGFDKTPSNWLGGMLSPAGGGWRLEAYGCVDPGEEEVSLRASEASADCFAISRELLERCSGPHPGDTSLERLQFAGPGAASLLTEAEANAVPCHYAAGATAIRRIDGRWIEPNGLFRRAFRRGVTASFEDIRADSVQVIEGSVPVSPPLEWVGPMDLPVDEILKSGWRQGYAWHQREVNRDKGLWRFVLKGSYRNY